MGKLIKIGVFIYGMAYLMSFEWFLPVTVLAICLTALFGIYKLFYFLKKVKQRA